MAGWQNGVICEVHAPEVLLIRMMLIGVMYPVATVFQVDTKSIHQLFMFVIVDTPKDKLPTL